MVKLLLIKMPMIIQVKGVKRVQKLFVRLGPAMDKEIMKKSNQFMKFVQKSAKLRAPRATGYLARSIGFRKGKKNEIILVVDAPYGAAQEFGFTPHVIPVQYMEMHYGTPGVMGHRIPRDQVSGWVLVGKNKPFITPALEAGISQLPRMLAQGTKQAINRAKK